MKILDNYFINDISNIILDYLDNYKNIYEVVLCELTNPCSAMISCNQCDKFTICVYEFVIQNTLFTVCEDCADETALYELECNKENTVNFYMRSQYNVDYHIYKEINNFEYYYDNIREINLHKLKKIKL